MQKNSSFGGILDEENGMKWTARARRWGVDTSVQNQHHVKTTI